MHKFDRLLPPSFLLISLLLILVLHFTIPIMSLVSTPYNYLGIFFIIFGGIMNIWTDLLFKKNNTNVKPDKMPAYLITDGPFKISRHPMYLGMFSILLGISIFFGSLVTIFPLIIFIIIIEAKFIPLEEKNTEKIFNKKYKDYKRQVRRWI